MLKTAPHHQVMYSKLLVTYLIPHQEMMSVKAAASPNGKINWYIFKRLKCKENGIPMIKKLVVNPIR